MNNDCLSENRRSAAPFTRREWIALLCVAVLAFGFAFFHPSVFSGDYAYLPGIGLCMSCWAMLAVGCGCIGWKALKWTGQSVFLLLCTLLLSACYGIFANDALRLLNLLPLTALMALSLFSLKNGGKAMEAESVVSAMHQCFSGLKRYFFAPFSVITQFFKEKKSKSAANVLLGIGVSLPLALVIMLLLCDADTQFQRLIGGFFSSFIHADALLPWNLCRMLLMTLALFSCLLGLLRPYQRTKLCLKKLSLPSAVAVIVLLTFSVIYTVFVFIQCRYLFAGASATLSGGTYAEYARQGFFQLVAVALITLAVTLPLILLFPKQRLIRGLCGYVLLLTLCIVYSAFFRMRLYVQVYGLTRLRVVTLWGIVVIFAVIIAVWVKMILPDRRIFAIIAAFTLCTWLGLNYINMDACIARYNIGHYEAGDIEELDLSYLCFNLSHDARNVIDEYISETDDALILQRYRNMHVYDPIDEREKTPCWYDWSFVWLK